MIADEDGIPPKVAAHDRYTESPAGEATTPEGENRMTLPDYLSYARDISYLDRLAGTIDIHPSRVDDLHDGRDIEQESVDAVAAALDDQGRAELYAAIRWITDTSPDPDADDAEEDETGVEPDPFVAEFTEVLEAYEADA